MTNTPPWYLRPSRALPVVAVALIAAALFAPQPSDARSGDPRLTTESASPQGARLLYELADRLQFSPSRSNSATFAADARVTYAVLDPVVPLRTSDVSALLTHVRAGGGALVVLGGGTRALADSLGVREPQAAETGTMTREVGECRRNIRRNRGLWVTQSALLSPVEFTKPPTGPLDSLLRVTVTGRRRDPVRVRETAALVGMQLGRGRIVLASDPDVFRNDAIRDCTLPLDVAAVRALEYLQDSGARPTIAFDEFHQHVAGTGVMHTLRVFLTGNPFGRAILQVAIATLVVMIGAAIRLLPPVSVLTVERRSPLESVDALARAYEQTQATRHMTSRLVRALRRRLERGTHRSRSSTTSDAQFLDRLGSMHPTVRPRTDLLKQALNEPTRARDVPRIADAVHEIETALRSSAT